MMSYTVKPATFNKTDYSIIKYKLHALVQATCYGVNIVVEGVDRYKQASIHIHSFINRINRNSGHPLFLIIRLLIR